jgi:hypothetical protein
VEILAAEGIDPPAIARSDLQALQQGRRRLRLEIRRDRAGRQPFLSETVACRRDPSSSARARTQVRLLPAFKAA